MSESAIALSATVFGGLAVFVASFQVALALGAPWGRLTWGGRFPGRLPRAMRGVAVVSGLVLVAFALIVAARAGLLGPRWLAAARVAVWVVVAYCGLGVAANTFTPSRGERMLWLPVVLVMLICSVIVATG